MRKTNRKKGTQPRKWERCGVIDMVKPNRHFEGHSYLRHHD
jgi:hypothetical protein